VDLTAFKSLVESRGHGVRRDGNNWRGRCPAHNDDGARGDLTFRQEGDRLLVKCWGGCENDKVMSALGLTMKDLFVGGNGHGGNGHKPAHAQPRSDQPPTTYASVEAAGSAIAKQLGGRFTAHWTYTGRDGSEAFKVLRFDECKTLDGKKSYRPLHRQGNGYIERDPPKPLILYHLPELLGDTTSVVFVTEGEKACDAARSIGLLATTSAHGAGNGKWTDWTPLAGTWLSCGTTTRRA